MSEKIKVKAIPTIAKALDWERTFESMDYKNNIHAIGFKNKNGAHLTVSMKDGFVCPCVFGA